VTRRTASRVAWAAWAVAIALALASIVLLVISIGAPTPEGHFGFRGFAASFALTFGTIGALVASRHPSNPIGWIRSRPGHGTTVSGRIPVEVRR
jgi:hypothetical protein